MRGSPIFRLVLTAIALALAGIPVWQLTVAREIPAPVAVSPESAGETRDVDATITASAPAMISVRCLGEVVLETSTPAATLKGRIPLHSTAPDDLVVSARWESSDSPHAVRVQILDGIETLADQTFWGTGSVEDIVTPQAP